MSLVHYVDPAGTTGPGWAEWVITGLAKHLPNHRIEEYFAVKEFMLGDGYHRAFAEEDGECVGIAVASDRQATVGRFSYIETLLVAEDHHGSPLGMALVRELFRGVVQAWDAFPDLVAMKTYNAKTYVLMRQFGGRDGTGFYPVIGEPPTAPHRTIAAALADVLAGDCAFDADSGVVRGGGGRVSTGFWPSIPVAKDDRVNAFFRDGMTPADRLLCFIHAPGEGAKKAVLDRLGL